MMKEAEAKKLMCPIRLNPASSALLSANAYCAGSGCMMWRWVNLGGVRWKTFVAADPCEVEEPARPAEVPGTWGWSPYDKSDAEASPACWTEPDAEARARSCSGYCGLAGDPPGLQRTVWTKDADRV